MTEEVPSVNFDDMNLSVPVMKALKDVGYESPSPIQAKTIPLVMAGKDLVGQAQTGTGKTIAYALPLLQGFKFSMQINPRVLVLVPTRELVLQVVENIESLAKYTNVRALGVYGGTNINTQKIAVAKGKQHHDKRQAAAKHDAERRARAAEGNRRKGR